MWVRYILWLVIPLLLAPFYARLVLRFTGQGGPELESEAVMVIRGLSLVLWILLIAVWGGSAQTAEEKRAAPFFPPLMLGAMVVSVLIVLVKLL